MEFTNSGLNIQRIRRNLLKNKESEYLLKILNRTAAIIADLESGMKSKSVDICFVGSNEINKLNRRFFGRDQVTDILSFTNDFPESDTLGELVINKDCLELSSQTLTVATIRPQKPGEHLRNPENSELALIKLFIHGTLHLLGYNHLEAKVHELMSGKENKILDSLLEIKTLNHPE